MPLARSAPVRVGVTPSGPSGEDITEPCTLPRSTSDRALLANQIDVCYSHSGDFEAYRYKYDCGSGFYVDVLGAAEYDDTTKPVRLHTSMNKNEFAIDMAVERGEEPPVKVTFDIVVTATDYEEDRIGGTINSNGDDAEYNKHFDSEDRPRNAPTPTATKGKAPAGTVDAQPPRANGTANEKQPSDSGTKTNGSLPLVPGPPLDTGSNSTTTRTTLRYTTPLSRGADTAASALAFLAIVGVAAAMMPINR